MRTMPDGRYSDPSRRASAASPSAPRSARRPVLNCSTDFDITGGIAYDGIWASARTEAHLNLLEGRLKDTISANLDNEDVRQLGAKHCFVWREAIQGRAFGHFQETEFHATSSEREVDDIATAIAASLAEASAASEEAASETEAGAWEILAVSECADDDADSEWVTVELNGRSTYAYVACAGIACAPAACSQPCAAVTRVRARMDAVTTKTKQYEEQAQQARNGLPASLLEMAEDEKHWAKAAHFASVRKSRGQLASRARRGK